MKEQKERIEEVEKGWERKKERDIHILWEGRTLELVTQKGKWKWEKKK